MRTITLPLQQFGFVVATRAALAAGVAFLVSDRLSDERRRALGVLLVAFGTVTTIPAARWASRSVRRPRPMVNRDPQLVGVMRYPRKGDDDFS